MISLYCMVGIQGSGKSTYSRTLQGVRLCADDIRLMIHGKSFDPNYEKVIWRFFDDMFEEALTTKYDVIIDNTNVTLKRGEFIHYAHVTDRKAVAVYMNTPLAVCLQRNATRKEPVPNHIIESAYKRLIVPDYSEGWDEIVTINYGQHVP